MSKNKMIIAGLKEKEEKALESLEIVQLQEIVEELLRVDKSKRNEFQAYVESFIENLFKNSISVSGIAELQRAYSIIGADGTQSRGRASGVDSLDFKTALNDLVKSISNFPTLKNNFLIELTSNPTYEYQCIIIYDENYFIHPFKKSVEERVKNVEFKKIDEVETYFTQAVDKNFIAMILLSPRINDAERSNVIIDKIMNLIDPFSTFHHITVCDFSDPSNHEKTTSKETFREELTFVSDHFLTNSDLDFEEEKAIKKLFENYGFPLLDYKILKGGKSGAKVVEVTPKRKSADSQGRKYVIKISREKEKIKQEIKRFRDFVADFRDLGSKYRIHDSSTINYSGLMYEYASASKHIKSHPLSTIIDDSDHPFNSQVESITEAIFDEKCFESWKIEMRSENWMIKELYKDYIKLDKTFSTIAKIENKSLDEIKSSDFGQKFVELLDKSLNIQIKICHGDLHTGNILIDEESEKYLIDFAFTEERHALTDHSSLECSFKFNHLARYFPIEELVKIEEELLEDESFYPSFVLKTTQREDLKMFFKKISIIRSDSLDYTYDKASKIEYLISLLMITFRQINYEDLNQMYAWKSAQVLADKISRVI